MPWPPSNICYVHQQNACNVYIFLAGFPFFPHMSVDIAEQKYIELDLNVTDYTFNILLSSKYFSGGEVLLCDAVIWNEGMNFTHNLIKSYTNTKVKSLFSS